MRKKVMGTIKGSGNWHRDVDDSRSALRALEREWDWAHTSEAIEKNKELFKYHVNRLKSYEATDIPTHYPDGTLIR
jgi:hypothetical protein